MEGKVTGGMKYRDWYEISSLDEGLTSGLDVVFTAEYYGFFKPSFLIHDRSVLGGSPSMEEALSIPLIFQFDAFKTLRIYSRSISSKVLSLF